MAKVTSKLLTLLLSFAMVFTSIGWLGVSEVNAAEGDTSLIVKLVDESGQPVSGIELKAEFQGEASPDFTFDAPSDADGLAVFDYEDESSLGWVDEENPNDYYKLMIDGESEYSFEPVDVVFSLFGMDTVACTKVGGKDYSQSEPYVITLTKASAEPELINYVELRANADEWAKWGINYGDITADDFVLDVRPDSNWSEGHLAGATHVNVALSDETQVKGGYVVEDSQLANDLDTAYAAAGGKRIVVVCVKGQTLAARTLQYFNIKYFGGEGVDLSKVTYLIGGAGSIPAEDMVVDVDYVDLQKNNSDAWGTYGINYADIKAEDFILDVRQDANWDKGHLAGSTHVAVTDTAQLADGYIVAGSAIADGLESAYAAAGEKRIVVICNGGQTLAARAIQYLNEKFFGGYGVDTNKVTYLIGGRTAIPDEDVVVAAPDTTVPRTTGEARSKTMKTTINMSKYDKGQVVKVWVPVPQTEDFQEISNEKIVAKTAKDARFTTSEGNKMLYIEWDENAEPKDRIATLTFDATRVEAGHPELVAYDESEFVWPEDVAEYINKTSTYVKIDGVVKDYADQITEGKVGTLAKARAIYEFVIANLERIDNGETLTNASGATQTFVVEGCGYGNTKEILTDLKNFGRAGGHCTDINSTFVALCRAAGIPAREMFGIRLGTNDKDNASGFQHCWAEFYLPGTGWVYADPGDVLKAIKPGKEKSLDEWAAARASSTCKEKTEYFWGTVDNNRIVLSRGRDVTFEPAQSWGPCNTFGYPAAEVGGVKTPEDFTVPDNFVYSIETKNIAEPVDFVDMQKTNQEAWGTYGINYADIKASDFILDVRQDANWDKGHLAGATHVDVTDATQLDNGYVKEDSQIADALEAAYEEAAGKRIVIICNGGQTLAARAMQYFNATDKDMDNITYLIGGRTAIPDEDVITIKWELADFVINGTTIAGLSDSGKEKLKECATLELPNKNAEGAYITEIGNGVNGLGTFGVKDGDNTYVPTAVVLPSKLEKIGNFAFQALLNTETGDQVGVKSVDFPATLTSIGNLAFQNAPMTEVVLPDKVSSLGTGAFTTAEKSKVKIETIKLSKALTVIPQSCFAQQAIKNVVIPEGVTEIGRMAFTGNFVETLELPTTLEKIQNQAFMNHYLTELVIPESVTLIGQSAFRFSSTGHGEDGEAVRASKLTKLTLKEGLQTIQKQAFDGNKLTEVNLPTTVTTLDTAAFSNNEVTVRLISTVEDQVNSVGDYTKVVAEGTGHKVNTKAGFAADDIADLPKEVTEENAEAAAEATAAARAAYDALSDEEKAALPAGTVEKLEAAEAKVEAAGAKTAAEKAKEDADSASKKASAVVGLANEVVAGASVNKSLYTTATVKAFDAAFDAAKATLNNEAASTDDLNKAAADLKAAREELKKKAANTLSVSKKTKTVKAAKVKKAKQTVTAITIKKHSGKVSYKKAGGSAKLTVNSKTGKITVKKGTKKGTYKIRVKVSAAGDGNHKAGSKTITVKVKVK